MKKLGLILGLSFLLVGGSGWAQPIPCTQVNDVAGPCVNHCSMSYGNHKDKVKNG